MDNEIGFDNKLTVADLQRRYIVHNQKFGSGAFCSNYKMARAGSQSDFIILENAIDHSIRAAIK